MCLRQQDSAVVTQNTTCCQQRTSPNVPGWPESVLLYVGLRLAQSRSICANVVDLCVRFTSLLLQLHAQHIRAATTTIFVQQQVLLVPSFLWCYHSTSATTHLCQTHCLTHFTFSGFVFSCVWVQERPFFGWVSLLLGFACMCVCYRHDWMQSSRSIGGDTREEQAVAAVAV